MDAPQVLECPARVGPRAQRCLRRCLASESARVLWYPARGVLWRAAPPAASGLFTRGAQRRAFHTPSREQVRSPVEAVAQREDGGAVLGVELLVPAPPSHDVAVAAHNHRPGVRSGGGDGGGAAARSRAAGAAGASAQGIGSAGDGTPWRVRHSAGLRSKRFEFQIGTSWSAAQEARRGREAGAKTGSGVTVTCG